MYWKLPYSFNIGQNLPEKNTSQLRYLERSKLAVLQNLSLIPTLMMKKIWMSGYPKSPHSIYTSKIRVWMLLRDSGYPDIQFFFHGSSSLLEWGLSSKAQLIWTFLSTFTEMWFFQANFDLCWSCRAISNTQSANFFFTDLHYYVNEA